MKKSGREGPFGKKIHLACETNGICVGKLCG